MPGFANDGKADFSIKAKESLTIGFNNSGTPPYTYFLTEDQDVDVGFLKLYISTKYIDYSSIAQRSPFSGQRASFRAQSSTPDLWHTLTIPVVQRRGSHLAIAQT